jgi:hypothetical protein
MKRVEERRGFAILLEAPPSRKSLWAAVVRAANPLGAALGVKVCLGCSREKVLADARAFVDEAAARRDEPTDV